MMESTVTATSPGDEVPSAGARPGLGPIHVVATPDIDASPMAAALAQALGASIDGVGVRGCTARDIAALSRQDPASRFIAFVDHPIRQVARGVVTGSDVAALLDQWRTDAKLLLRAVQVAPHRFLCLDLAEVESLPACLPDRLGKWLHLDSPLAIAALGRSAGPEQGPLAQALAQEIVRADRATTLLWDELLACCVVLGNDLVAAKPSILAAAAAEYRNLRGAHERSRLELSAARQENELLILQLHQLQEELEHYYLQLKEADATAPGYAVSNPLHVEHVHQVHRSDGAPHRHLQLRFEGVVATGGRWSALDVRLVEHLGRPGLVLFADAAGRRPLSAWQASGREGEREFMLMVPSDSLGPRLFQPMGSADWHLVTGLAARVHQHVHGQSGQDPWPTVATRLCRQLADLPARLRYDRLSTNPTGRESQVFEVRIGESTFGALQLGDIVLQWDSRRDLMHWQAPEDALRMPLSNWPVAPDGKLAPTLTLPVGSNHSHTVKRAFWSGLSAADRELTLAVLDALPAAAKQATHTNLPEKGPWNDLARDAAAWHREARRLLAAMRWGRIVRRLFRFVR